MRVVHIGTSDNSGGAARASFRLHTGLLARGVGSRMLVGIKTERRADVDGLPRRDTRLRRQFIRAVGLLEQATGLQYQLLPWKRQFARHPFVRDADVINLHNLHGGFFSFNELPGLSELAPLIWTIHDPWSMTGHCSYPDLYGCTRWRIGCGRCPALGDYPEISVDTTALLWRRKRAAYARAEITVVAPSTWIGGMAKESPLFGGRPVHVIPYGVDTAVFRPIPKRAAREVLGLPEAARVVLFSASSLESPRKGAKELKQALELLRPRLDDPSDVVVLSVGAGSIAADGRVSGFPLRAVGAVEDDRLLAACYSSADVFVVPTLADNLPNALIESAACGTPAVAFGAGGVPDIVRHGETGVLAAPGDVAALADGIRQLLEDVALRTALGHRARAMAEEEFAIGNQARRYIDLYQSVQRRDVRSDPQRR